MMIAPSSPLASSHQVEAQNDPSSPLNHEALNGHHQPTHDEIEVARMVTLVSKEGKELVLAESVAALMSETLLPLLNQKDKPQVIPLPYISEPILSHVFDFCEFHEKSPSEEEVQEYHQGFLACFAELKPLQGIINAAYELKIPKLLDLTAQEFADRYITGKTAEQIRSNLNIPNDFTDEEAAEILRENQWQVV